jgi:hypothetical protein
MHERGKLNLGYAINLIILFQHDRIWNAVCHGVKMAEDDVSDGLLAAIGSFLGPLARLSLIVSWYMLDLAQ